MVYIGFGSHCDHGPWRGYVMAVKPAARPECSRCGRRNPRTAAAPESGAPAVGSCLTATTQTATRASSWPPERNGAAERPGHQARSCTSARPWSGSGSMQAAAGRARLLRSRKCARVERHRLRPWSGHRRFADSFGPRRHPASSGRGRQGRPGYFCSIATAWAGAARGRAVPGLDGANDWPVRRRLGTSGGVRRVRAAGFILSAARVHCGPSRFGDRCDSTLIATGRQRGRRSAIHLARRSSLLTAPRRDPGWSGRCQRRCGRRQRAATRL